MSFAVALQALTQPKTWHGTADSKLIASHPASGPDCAHSNSVSLASGATATITIVATVNCAVIDGGSVVNFVSVASDDDANPETE